MKSKKLTNKNVRNLDIWPDRNFISYGNKTVYISRRGTKSNRKWSLKFKWLNAVPGCFSGRDLKELWKALDIMEVETNGFSRE